MIFQDIKHLSNRIKEISDFDYTDENKNKINSFKSDLENIIGLELENNFLSKKLHSISLTPKEPYFLEMGNKIRRETWIKGVSEIQRVALLVVNELQKTASISSQADIKEIISKNAEDSFFEFKSTFRWDVKENRINKELEIVVLKSIASFSNSKGGNLLIGVEDNGNVLGLDLDCATLKGGNATRDEFELHLRNKLENIFGITFTTNQLEIIFPIINTSNNEQKEICHVKILQGEKPVFIEKVDKNGVKREVFFIRSGNSSKEIEKMSVFFEYAQSRFRGVN